MREKRKEVVVVVVITPSLPRDGGTARTAIQVRAVNLIKIRLGERWQPLFEPVLSDRQPHHQQGGLPLVGTQESPLTPC